MELDNVFLNHWKKVAETATGEELARAQKFIALLESKFVKASSTANADTATDNENSILKDPKFL